MEPPMNRRSFLSTLALGMAALADPERLLWVPTKTIFIPSAPVVFYKRFEIDMDFTAADLALTMDEFQARYFRPAIEHYMLIPLDRDKQLGPDFGFEWLDHEPQKLS